MSIDIKRARKETPGCEHVLHLNNAGASLMPQPVVNAVIDHLKLESQIGGYEAFARSMDQIEHFYHSAAKLLNSHREEIAFIENATRAWDMLFYSLQFNDGDRILTSPSEYASNYIAFLQVARRTGACVDVVPADESGAISLDALKSAIDDRVKLIAITHVPTNSGLINPAQEVGKIANDAGVLFLLDACQSAGQMPVDVQKIGCDMLSATGRKFLRGPRGTGFLFIRQGLIQKLEPIFLDLHAATWITEDRYEVRNDARRFENWEQNYAGKIGLAAATEYALDWGLSEIQVRIQQLASSLRRRLSTLSGIRVRDVGTNLSGIVTFTSDHLSADAIKNELAMQKINVSVSTRSSTLLDMTRRGLSEVVRASVHYYNTEEELERFCGVLNGL